ncbi:MAG: hypothetical protein OEV46_00560 [Betaproteobacteria bacterium]|jgi:hypothetical protein|nr:hypothetical protein [Betaproteobacteria bacterium]MDH5285988.1 hypothetical protein [Betaproteobacteria bacterium]
MGSPLELALKLGYILVCGALGALCGVAIADLLGLAGVPAAIAAVFTGMVVATLAFALGIALARKAGWLA